MSSIRSVRIQALPCLKRQAKKLHSELTTLNPFNRPEID